MIIILAWHWSSYAAYQGLGWIINGDFHTLQHRRKQIGCGKSSLQPPKPSAISSLKRLPFADCLAIRLKDLILAFGKLDYENEAYPRPTRGLRR